MRLLHWLFKKKQTVTCLYWTSSKEVRRNLVHIQHNAAFKNMFEHIRNENPSIPDDHLYVLGRFEHSIRKESDDNIAADWNVYERYNDGSFFIKKSLGKYRLYTR